MIYGGFEIQSFEAGRGLWHASINGRTWNRSSSMACRFRRSKSASRGTNPDAAIADAKAQIDRFIARRLAT